MGFLNGTRILNKEYSILCQTNINRYVYLATQKIPTDLSNIAIYDLIYDAAELAANTYVLESTCYLGYQEGNALVNQYLAGF